MFEFIFLMFVSLTGSVNMGNVNFEKATLGGGCFWCTEAVYKQLKGVTEVIPGYSGGFVTDPTYKEVCTGNTGHAEVVQVTFNPEVISYEEILTVFFQTHDPTTLNRQGADMGTQYRSVIFYHSEEQKETALQVKNLIDQEKVYDDPIVTEITEFKTFYPAEDYHLDYFARNKNQPYCQFVIAPKMKKFQKVFKEKLK